MSPMPRAKDNSRGATERETMANIQWAKEAAEVAKEPEGLTELGKAFFRALKK